MGSQCCQILTIFLFFATVNSFSDNAETSNPEISDNPSLSKLYPLDEKKFQGLRTEMCSYLSFGNSGLKNLTWSDSLTEEEIYELSILSIAFGLTTDAVAHLPVDLGWRKIVMDEIAFITRKTCQTTAISSTFLAGIKNIFLYYMIKMEQNVMKQSNTKTKEEWEAQPYLKTWTRGIISKLSTCATEVTPIEFQNDCGILDSFIDGAGKTQPTMEIGEIYDDQFDYKNQMVDDGLDIVIDSVWWMFATSFARCYAILYPHDDSSMLMFLRRFRKDILNFFIERWQSANDLVEHFSLMFGKTDPLREHHNLRLCATAAFEYEGLRERYLVRPVIVKVNRTYIRNAKKESPLSTKKDIL